MKNTGSKLIEKWMSENSVLKGADKLLDTVFAAVVPRLSTEGLLMSTNSFAVR